MSHAEDLYVRMFVGLDPLRTQEIERLTETLASCLRESCVRGQGHDVPYQAALRALIDAALSGNPSYCLYYGKAAEEASDALLAAKRKAPPKVSQFFTRNFVTSETVQRLPGQPCLIGALDQFPELGVLLKTLASAGQGLVVVSSSTGKLPAELAQQCCGDGGCVCRRNHL